MNSISIILLLITAFILFLAGLTLQKTRSKEGVKVCLLLTSCALYSFGYAFELSSHSYQNILFWLKIEYLGISFLPLFIMTMALHYTEKTQRIKARATLILLFFALITLILQHSNCLHLFYKNFNTNISGHLTLSAFSKGPWYWVHQVILNAVILISSIMYLQTARSSKGVRHSRAMLLFIASLFPWVFYLAYIIGLSPYKIDIVPFSFPFLGTLYVLGILKYNLFDFFPIALKNVFKSLPSGIIILDHEKRLVDFNPAAKKIIPGLAKDLAGIQIFKLKALHPLLANLIQDNNYESTSEIEVAEGNLTKYFQVNINPVVNKQEHLLGYTMILNDITHNKQKEKELLEKETILKEQNIAKDKLLAIIAHDLRNPFHIMINMSQVVQTHASDRNLQGVERTVGALEDISRNTYNLLQNLLEWAATQNGKGLHPELKHLNAKDLIEHVIKELKYS